MKLSVIQIGILIFLVGLASCQTESKPAVDGPQVQKFKQEVTATMNDVVKDPKVRNLIQYEIADMENLKLVGGPNPYIGFHLTDNPAKVNNGVRSEIAMDYPFTVGDQVTYEWAFKIPKDFEHDAPKNRWWTLAQWHDQPNRDKKESWDKFPSRSPPIAIYYGHKDGTDFMSFKYLNQEVTESDVLPIEKGRWINMRVEIKWQQDNSGYAKVYVDNKDEPAIFKRGPNMHNAFQHYFKLGMYRHPDIKTQNTMYVNNSNITKSAE